MEKSVSSRDYSLFLAYLRDARKKAGLTQGQLAELLGETQSFVSKCERGERRLDIVEVRTFCLALSVPFPSFATQLDTLLTQEEGKGRARRVDQEPGR
jgi:transcriptional regulator with XRE-family HTH domain